ncbi:solute carrier organic anion transporter family member 1A2-like isoform X3 [Numida meleagris]|uniref:solute carrier organic anion transporter family member 1A2-like isoform X3 n=1 Tax=Numida meleagris TaxID=8996 RepID=UPI000B3E1EDB|nr:solute carrier organic anion transporter family member 1A2-like isoform X3 [Numida meleagris]
MKETRKPRADDKFCGISRLKLFLLALALAFIGKTMTGAYLNSMYTQIEKQFNIPASLVGIINGSFEIGNLLLIAFVSYFGGRFHRPKIIALGCTVFAFGCLLTSFPHFLFGRYHIESSISPQENSSVVPLCHANQSLFSLPTEEPSTECEKEPGSLLWVFVMVGNLIRGMGETPIVPLGISYLEDFAKTENSPFYQGCLHTATVIGPFLGYLLSSFCAKLFVDLESVDAGDLTITPADVRWVGAWWLGILICALVNFLAGLPFWFLPRSLVKEGENNESEETYKKIGVLLEENEQKEAKQTMYEIAKGVYNIPIICLGYFFGGLFMKKFKINTYQAAHIACWVTFLDYLLYFIAFWTICDTSPVAGLTVSYEGIDQLSYAENTLLADCNRDCDCTLKVWDPVCANNGITYVSSCLAGCKASTGTGKSVVFENCTCVATSAFSFQNASAILGQCDRGENCDKMLHYFLILQLVGSFIFSLAAMPGYMVLIRSLKPEEKSLGVGIHELAARVLAGIPSPIFFGALIDTTCMKWGTKSCGGEGACRMYDIVKYRWIYLGLPALLRGVSFIPSVITLFILKKKLTSERNVSLNAPVELQDKEQ